MFRLKGRERIALNWTVNWSHSDNTANVDIMTERSARDATVQRTADMNLNTAHNLVQCRVNEETCSREMRVVEMEGIEHPLGWLLFKITRKG